MNWTKITEELPPAGVNILVTCGNNKIIDIMQRVDNKHFQTGCMIIEIKDVNDWLKIPELPE
jgi:hypothetical protein